MGETEQKKRGFFDWATTAIAPLGIFAGPISIASMFSHLIVWHGPLGYLVNFWKEEIRAPFRHGIEWAAQLLSQWVHIPKPPDLLVDYIVLSLLLTSSYCALPMWCPRTRYSTPY